MSGVVPNEPIFDAVSAVPVRLVVCVLNCRNRDDRRTFMEDCLKHYGIQSVDSQVERSTQHASTASRKDVEVFFLDGIEGSALVEAAAYSDTVVHPLSALFGAQEMPAAASSRDDAAIHTASCDGAARRVYGEQDEAAAATAAKWEAFRNRWTSGGLVPMSLKELQSYYGRPVSRAEMGCFFSHMKAWRWFAEEYFGTSGDGIVLEEAGAPYLVVLEDDAVPICPADAMYDSAPDRAKRWTQVFNALRATLAGRRSCCEKSDMVFDLLYLGRNKLEEAQGAHGDCVEQVGEHNAAEMREDEATCFDESVEFSGFSSCLHAYCLSADGARKLLDITMHLSVIPAVDDWVPALIKAGALKHDRRNANTAWRYHPRPDIEPLVEECLRKYAEENGGSEFKFFALAFKEDLVARLYFFCTLQCMETMLSYTVKAADDALIHSFVICVTPGSRVLLLLHNAYHTSSIVRVDRLTVAKSYLPRSSNCRKS